MTLEVGNLIAFMTYAMQILISFMMLSAIFIMVPRAQASADRINEVLDEEVGINDPKDPKKLALAGKNATLAFEHVNYRYHGAEKLALEDIDFSAKSGEIVAIIGVTGSGTVSYTHLDVYKRQGSACTAGNIEPSHVLEAMYGKDTPILKESIRISFGYGNTKEDIQKFIQQLVGAIK